MKYKYAYSVAQETNSCKYPCFKVQVFEKPIFETDMNKNIWSNYDTDLMGYNLKYLASFLVNGYEKKEGGMHWYMDTVEVSVSSKYMADAKIDAARYIIDNLLGIDLDDKNNSNSLMKNFAHAVHDPRCQLFVQADKVKPDGYGVVRWKSEILDRTFTAWASDVENEDSRSSAIAQAIHEHMLDSKFEIQMDIYKELTLNISNIKYSLYDTRAPSNRKSLSELINEYVCEHV